MYRFPFCLRKNEQHPDADGEVKKQTDAAAAAAAVCILPFNPCSITIRAAVIKTGIFMLFQILEKWAVGVCRGDS